jgi:formylglycine-generating enzyme required for sulfatase activity
MQQDEQAKTQPKDPPKNFTNSIGMKFKWIPPGSFMMGSPKDCTFGEDPSSSPVAR